MLTSKQLFQRRRQRTRAALRAKTNGKARLSVFRSSKNIYAQVIDDLKGETLVSASSLEKAMREQLKTGADKSAAAEIGKLIGEVMREVGGADPQAVREALIARLRS